MKVLGIDEAGRGPVIGPMVMAGVMIEEGDEHLLEGAKDSKLVKHADRMHLDKKFHYSAISDRPIRDQGERAIFFLLRPLFRPERILRNHPKTYLWFSAQVKT